QPQLAVAAEVDGAAKAYDGRLGSGAVLGELGDGGGRGPFGVVDDPLSDTALSGCKRRKKERIRRTGVGTEEVDASGPSVGPSGGSKMCAMEESFFRSC